MRMKFAAQKKVAHSLVYCVLSYCMLSLRGLRTYSPQRGSAIEEVERTQKVLC